MYIYCEDNQIKYIGRCKGTYTFKKRINDYGNIYPKNCYVDGQSTNCHINSLIIENNKEKIILYIDVMDSDLEIIQVEDELIKMHQPAWNIALKNKS
ncbi:hypothetical protein N752_24430 [Desulforamulus aquiferis]|nr:hypothetical protein [Desulforamulus aquiferis]RYD02479.1 hypothetical protein N752_24430 [Desulforamulus aquiferis]